MAEIHSDNEADSSREIRNDLERALTVAHGPQVARFAMACMTGLIPGGAVIGSTGNSYSGSENDHFQRVFQSWLKLQEEELKEIGTTLAEIIVRLDLKEQMVLERIESPAYLSLIKKAFRDWSAAESEEKRVLVRNLLVNAATTQVTEDGLVRLFVEWIGQYSETHFKVIRDVYQNPGTTRAETWERINGREVREDSAEADLFKLLIHDLSVGRIIRQHRDVDDDGNFVKKKTNTKAVKSQTMTSAFEDGKAYVLTDLGKQFVHYTMTEATTKISDTKEAEEQKSFH